VGETFPSPFGRYQLVERLALGGMAELFVATSPGEHGFQKRVVIKRLLPHLVHDETYTAMFIDEAKLTARLVHPKIAQTYALDKVGDQLFIAMEYVEGIDVLALLREYAAAHRRVEPPLAAWIAHEVLEALDYAHGLADESGAPLGVVHRDISPSNVLLSLRGDVKLVDFGIARASDPNREHKSKSGTLKGKYGYMSPEQVVEQPLDQRSDLFSVGVVLAEMLTGRRLFAAANELDVLLMVRDAKLGRFEKYGADLEPGLKDIVRRALKKPVDERWQSAAEFRDGLANWLFDQRHRVTGKQVADVVAELNDAVVARRQNPAAQAVATAVLEDVAPIDDGIPLVVDEGVSMPIISMVYDGPSGAISMPEEIRAPLMSTLAAAPSVATPAPSRGAELPPRRVLRRSDAPPLAAIIDVELDDPTSELSARFPSIAAAVHSIVPVEPDPAMRDFDDITIEPAGGRSREIKLPTAAEVARKPPPAPPLLADIAEPSDDAGDFAQIPPLRVLFRLMTARATGLLVVAIGGIKKEIYVRDGQPEYVSSNVASELFGNYLVSKGVLSDGELAMALAMMPHYGGKLGDTLVGLGLLKPLEVFRHLTRQVRTKLIDVCTWNKGEFGWYAGRENPREAFPLDFNAFEILGAGALTMAEDLVEAWVARQGAVKLRASRTRRVGPERFEVKGLVELFESLDGRRSVGEVVELQLDRGERLKIGRMLMLLEACDLARTA
jgi:serine/threonine-protein kinase